MQSPGNGIFDKTSADDAKAVTIVNASQVVSSVALCDPAVGRKLYGALADGANTLQSIVANIQGQSLSPQQIRGTLQPFVTGLTGTAQPNIVLDSIAALTLLSSGSGTLVQIDDNNCFYNIGYEAPVVKSGRSFGRSAGRGVLDATDNYYLNEVGQYLSPATTPDTSAFYHAVLKVLTNCDASGFAALGPSGQTVATDLVTVYTAELDRHVMVNLVPSTDPWEIDIAEVTLLANYSAASGMVMQNGALVAAPVTAYASKGSIGNSRADFMSLASQISSFESVGGNHPDLVKAITDLTPIQDPPILGRLNGDVFRRLLVYLNRPEFQGDVQKHPADFENAMVNLLIQVRIDAAAITQKIQSP